MEVNATPMKVIISILIVVSFWSCDQDNVVDEFIVDTNNEMINGLNDDIDRLVNDFNELLQDPSKRKYRPLGRLFNSIDSAFLQHVSIETDSTLDHVNLDSFTQELITINQAVPENIATCLALQYDSMGLNLKEKEEYQRGIGEIMDFENVINLLQRFDRQEDVPRPIGQSIIIDLLHAKKSLLSELIVLGGGRPISCWFGISPQVVPSQNIVRAGEKFKAQITIVPYDFEFHPSTLKVYVDGVEQEFDEFSRFIQYESEALQQNKTLLIEGLRLDNWSLEFQSAWYPYKYEIVVMD